MKCPFWRGQLHAVSKHHRPEAFPRPSVMSTFGENDDRSANFAEYTN